MKFNNDMLRLYAVTDRHWTGEQTLYEQVRDVLMGGATCLQLREKDLDEASFYEEAFLKIQNFSHRLKLRSMMKSYVLQQN